MNVLHPETHSRRAFLRRAGQLALAGTAAPFALNLAAIGEAAAFSATDYKALVCVYLTGGNDQANTVVSYDSASHARYSAIRAPARSPHPLGLTRAALAATVLRPTQPLPGGLQYALHPAMGELAALFNAGRAAVQLNVGPLAQPLTKAQYLSSDRTRHPIPSKLFSHNDQQSVWQSGEPEGAAAGWGGAMGDLALAANGQSLFTCISAAGGGVFVSGRSALAYQISTEGAVQMEAARRPVYGSGAVSAALAELVQQTRSHELERAYTSVTTRALNAEARVNEGLAGAAMATAFPAGNSLADQLRIVARLIAARAALGVKRQVFLVSLPGFDLHDGLMIHHGGLLAKLSGAMAAFHRATQDLGLGQQVTAFTASDFGRTLVGNGDGTDHGWGSHHLMVGGAVRGAAFYGTPPPVSVGETSAPEDQWHVGQGRLLPTTSVDQYAATLARWFGVSDTELSTVLPRVGLFGAGAGQPGYPVNLGFMG